MPPCGGERVLQNVNSFPVPVGNVSIMITVRTSLGAMAHLSFTLSAFLFLSLLGMGACTNSESALTDSQREKLDPALQRLVEGGDPTMDRYSTSESDDGTTVYSVILRSDDPSALREAGLPINSVRGDIVTARLTVSQIREAARLDAVRRIENPSQMSPTS